MKQKIGTMLPPTEPVSDLHVVFCALYNLLYEKIEAEPNKGIVVSKGNPNQRKVTWKEVMLIAHALEDFFIFRKQRTGFKECQMCEYWESVSQASPHMGRCNKKKQEPVHAFSSCKKFKLNLEGRL